MRFEKTTTGLIIREPSDLCKRKVLQYFSLSKPIREFFIYSGNDVDNKPLFGNDKDVIYITSGFLGIKDNEIQNMKNSTKSETITPKLSKRIELVMTRSPRSKLQEDCIKTLTTSTSSKITIEVKPGVE